MKQAYGRAVNQDGKIEESLNELKNLKFALDESAIVAVTDTNGVITYVNQTFCDISQYSYDELIGKTHHVINSGYHPKAFFADMWNTISSGRVWKGAVKNRAKDGSFYWVDTTIVPFLDEAGNPYQYIAIRKDITYLKRVENELRILNEGLEERIKERTVALETLNQELSATLIRLQESDRIRETFVAALTHDLRTPLIAEQRVIELLKPYQVVLPPAFQNVADRLDKNNAEILSLVNKLLEIYQYEAGKVGLLIEPVDLSILVDECIDSLRPLAEQRQIMVENNIASKLGKMAVDREQVKRVVYNLLHNAIKNINEQNKVMISANEDEQWVFLIVQDNGPGITKEILPHLFDRYFVSQQAKKKIGSGLGLSICNMIVKLHKGSIEVDSELGKGTTFQVKLPKVQEL